MNALGFIIQPYQVVLLIFAAIAITYVVTFIKESYHKRRHRHEHHH